MSYQQFQQKCNVCQRTWNAALGIVNNHIIAEPPDKCPFCGSIRIIFYKHGWEWAKPPTGAVESILHSLPILQAISTDNEIMENYRKITEMRNDNINGNNTIQNISICPNCGYFKLPGPSE